MSFSLFFFIILPILAYKQDISERYWYTTNGNSFYPTDWQYIPMSSISQIIPIDKYSNDSPIWFIDSVSHCIFSSNSTTSWRSSLKMVTIDYNGNIKHNINIIDNHTFILPLFNINSSFYMIVVNEYIL
eukprot:55545_1